MQSCAENRHWPAIAVVGRIHDVLIVKRDLPGLGQGVTVISFQDPFGTGMWKLSVTDQNSEAARIEKGLVHAGDGVDHPGDAKCVVRSSPTLARDRQAP